MKLIFHTLSDGVQEFEVPLNSVLIGRGSNCDVILKVEGLSRQHCKIEIDRKGNFLITDLGSTNGAMIDNQRIAPHTPTPFTGYQSLTIGSIPSVTVQASEDEAVREVPYDKKSPTQVVLDLPKKKQTKRRAVPAISNVEVERKSPWPLVIGLLVVVALTYIFFRDL